MIFFLLSFLVLGAGIKFIDAAYDEKTFNKKIALAVAPILGILWAYTMLINPAAATILLAILCGVFFKGKIDNFAHLSGMMVILAIVFIAGIQLMIMPLLLLAAAAFLDEVGNDLIDKYKDKIFKNKLSHKICIYFFDHRWVMKVALLSLVILSMIPYYFLFAMILFDEAYIIVRWYSQSGHKIISEWRHTTVKAKTTP
jgi:hypothetical protein